MGSRQIVVVGGAGVGKTQLLRQLQQLDAAMRGARTETDLAGRGLVMQPSEQPPRGRERLTYEYYRRLSEGGAEGAAAPTSR